MGDVIQWVGWISLAAGVIAVILGVAYAIMDLGAVADARAAAIASAEKAKQTIGAGNFQQQADVSGTFDSLAKLAAALKDLDKSMRYFVVSLGFLGVAALAAGADTVSTAISAG